MPTTASTRGWPATPWVWRALQHARAWGVTTFRFRTPSAHTVFTKHGQFCARIVVLTPLSIALLQPYACWKARSKPRRMKLFGVKTRSNSSGKVRLNFSYRGRKFSNCCTPQLYHKPYSFCNNKGITTTGASSWTPSFAALYLALYRLWYPGCLALHFLVASFLHDLHILHAIRNSFIQIIWLHLEHLFKASFIPSYIVIPYHYIKIFFNRLYFRKHQF